MPIVQGKLQLKCVECEVIYIVRETNMSAIDTVKAKASEKRQQLESSPSADPRDIKIIDIIEELICDKSCFLKLGRDFGCEVLSLIGFTLEEILEIYPKLVQDEFATIKGNYTLIERPEANGQTDT